MAGRDGETLQLKQTNRGFAELDRMLEVPTSTTAAISVSDAMMYVAMYDALY